MAFPYLSNRTYSGSAQPTTLSTQIASPSDSSFTLLNAGTWLTTDPTTGKSSIYPLGTDYTGINTNIPFVVAVDYGTANEEKILCQAVNFSTGVVTVWTDGAGNNGRGYDGTTAQSHAAGAICVPVFSAGEADEANNAAAGTIGLIQQAGDMLVGNAAKSMSRLGAGTSGYLLTSNGTTSAPSWQALNAGSLSGAGSTSGQVLTSTGSSTAPTFQSLPIPSTFGNVGQYLVSNGSGVAPTWQNALVASASTTTQTNLTTTNATAITGLATSSTAYSTARKYLISVTLQLSTFGGTANTTSVYVYNGSSPLSPAIVLPGSQLAATDTRAFSAQYLWTPPSSTNYTLSVYAQTTAATVSVGNGTVGMSIVVTAVA